MLGSEAMDLIRRRVNRATSASTELNSWILQEMKQAQSRLEQEETLPWFLITERAYSDVTISEERVAIPSDMLREIENERMELEDTETGTKYGLTKRPYDIAKQRYGTTEGRPEVYALSGAYFRLRPIPDKSTYRMWMSYYGAGAVITEGAENVWLKHAADLIIAEAGIPIATALKNESALALFTNLRTSERARVFKNTIAKEMENFDPNPEDI